MKQERTRNACLLPLAGALLGDAAGADCANVAGIGSNVGDSGGVLVLQGIAMVTIVDGLRRAVCCSPG